MKTICITGASGCIGRALLEELMGKYRIKALFRSESELSRYWQGHGCEVILGNLSDETAIADLVRGTEAVFHCAATMAKNDYDTSYKVNVLGTKALVEKAAEAKCNLFVHVSSISVYAATCTPDNIYTEEIAPQNIDQLNNYSYTKYLSELTVKQICQEQSLAYMIIRPTNVYGPDSKPWFLNICELVRKSPVLVGDLELDFVHVHDVAKAIVQAAESSKAFNQTFHVGHEMLPLREFCAATARLLKKNYRFLPAPADRYMRRLIDCIYKRMTGKRTSYSFVHPACYSHAKAASLFNYKPEIKISHGLVQTVFQFHQRNQKLQFQKGYLQNGRRFESVEKILVSSETELVEAVQKARDQKISIRATGAMGSKNKNFHTAGISLDLSALDRLVSIRGDLVTVQSGMKLRMLFDILKANGLALPSIGEWTGATVAGTISTGTHGGSVHYGSISSLIHSMKIVLADGTTMRVDREHELFDYVGVSFGILGIISEVTFRCVPHFRLQLEKEIISLEKFMRTLEELNRRYRYFSGIWIPSAGNLLLYKAHPTELERTSAKRDHRYNLKNDSICVMCNRLALTGLFKEKVFKRPIVGDWDEILAPIGEDSVVSQYLRDNLKLPMEVEISVPLEDAANILHELNELFQVAGVFPLLPIGVRCGGKEDFLLSPCYKRDSLWLAFFVQNNEHLLSRICSIVMRYHCRAHWGKNTGLPEEYLKTQYERWDDVVKAKRQLDPDTLFSNAFTHRFGI